MPTADEMFAALLPAAIGAGAGYAYTQVATGPKLDPTSFMIGGTAAALGVASLATAGTPKPNPILPLAFAGSTLSIIAYDRWHDRMWPFAPAQP